MILESDVTSSRLPCIGHVYPLRLGGLYPLRLGGLYPLGLGGLYQLLLGGLYPLRRAERGSLCSVPRTRARATTLARVGDLVAERDPLRPSGRLLRDGDMDASYIDLADPCHLEFDYMRWMRIVLRAVRAKRVLHVGGGACALARALAAENPGGRQQVCEVDADVLALARAHLGLRRAPGLRVRLIDGRAFIAGQAAMSWDAVVTDAFVAATVPRRLITAEALADVARVAPMALVNVVDNRAARDVQAVAAGLTSAYPRVWALGGRGGNTVVVGAAAPLDLARVAALAAADPSPARLTDPGAMALSIAGAAPLRDAQGDVRRV